LPIRYRDFIYKQLREHYEKQAKDQEKHQKSLKSKTSQTAKPNIKPTYTVKAPKK
jgi:hypothetical protein